MVFGRASTENKMEFYLYDGNQVPVVMKSTFSFEQNVKYVTTVTYTPSPTPTYVIYVDGVLVQTVVSTTPMKTLHTVSNTFIGKSRNAQDVFLNGNVFFLAAYDRSLHPTDIIDQHLCARSCAPCPLGYICPTTNLPAYMTCMAGEICPAPGTMQWWQTASEGYRFSVSAPTLVRYGAGSNWLYKTVPAGEVPCTNVYFGKDPYFGVYKGCYTQESWSRMAEETGSFNLATSQLVRYGAGSKWLFVNVNAGVVPCTNAFFGSDPYFGVVKACFTQSINAIAQACPVGYYCDSTRLIQPKPCPVNTFTDKPGSTSCTPCPVGSSNNSTGSTRCYS